MNYKTVPNKGYQVVTGTSLVTANFVAFTVIATAVVSAIGTPNGSAFGEVTKYSGSGLPGVSLPTGLYDIRGSSITLTSGSVILWLE